MPTSFVPPPPRFLPAPSDSMIEEEIEDEGGSGNRNAALPGGIQARIAALNLNQVGLKPTSRPSKRQSSLFSSLPSSAPPFSSSPTSSLFSTSTLASTTSRRSSAEFSQPQASATTHTEVSQDEKKQQVLTKRPPVPPSFRAQTVPVTACEAPPSQSRASFRLSMAQIIPLVSADQIPLEPIAPSSPRLPSPSPPSPSASPIWRSNRAPSASPPPPFRTPSPQSKNSFVPGVSCIKCHDFSQVDQHAKGFSQHSLTQSDELVQALVEPFDTETEKARALFAWFYHTVAEDVREIGTPEIGLTDDPEQVKLIFVDICARFADLFVDLANRAGLNAYLVWGYSKTHEITPLYKPDDDGELIPPYQNNDAWICMMMDGEWHSIVPTWGRGFVSETEESIPHFASRWFTSTTPLEFLRTHFPHDSTYQLVSEDDGGPISWETFITIPTTPSIDGEFYKYDLNPATLQPHEANLEGGQDYTFTISKNCEHLSLAYKDNYCFVLFFEGEDGSAGVPLVHDEEEGGWSVAIHVPASSLGCTIHLGAVSTIFGQDAKGLRPERFAQQEKIRKSACIRSLVQWSIV